MKKLLVAGSSGLIGSEVVGYLCAQGWELHGSTRTTSEPISSVRRVTRAGIKSGCSRPTGLSATTNSTFALPRGRAQQPQGASTGHGRAQRRAAETMTCRYIRLSPESSVR